MKQSKELIRVENLSKEYTDKKNRTIKALNQLNISIYEGETLGLVGESGCGKSTTGNLLVKLLKETEGNIFYKGVNITNISDKEFKNYRKDIQMIFQDPYASINPTKKIGWMLEEPLIIHKLELNKTKRKKMVYDILETVGLDKSYADRYPKNLSGGQRQRISIAIALISNPAFIVADEPVSALDVSIQAQILNLMKSLQSSYNLTYLFISHDLNVVSYLSDRIGVMYLGNLIELGTTEDISNTPLHPYTQALFSASADIDEDEKERIILKGDIPSPVKPPNGCSFHTRCSKCMDICKTIKPKTIILENNRQVACHYVEEALNNGLKI